MTPLQKARIRAVVLTLAAAVVFAGLVSVNACRVSQFGFNDIVAVWITPAEPVMAGGTQLQLRATGVYADGTTEDLTDFAAWASSDPTVTVTEAGLVTAEPVAATRTCIITATEAQGVSGGVSLSVRSAQLNAIDVSPPSAALDGGTAAVLTATGTFISTAGTFSQDISSMATWSTSNEAVATVDRGKVAGVSGGTASVTASWGTIVSNESVITVSGTSLVSLDINPKDAVVQRMKGVFFTADGIFDDGSVKDLTQAVTWTSSDTEIARIGTYNMNVPGMTIITLHIPGTVTITATLGNVTATTTLTASETAPY